MDRVVRIGGKVTEKRTVLIAFRLSLNECHRFPKPDICAVTVKRLFGTVAEIGVVEIIVAPIVRSLTDTTTAVIECFVETPVVWTETGNCPRGAISQTYRSYSRCVGRCPPS